MRKSKLVKNNVESVSKELNNDLRIFMKISLKMNKHYLKKDYKLLIESGQAEKISPKASGMLTWQLAMSETDNELYLRLVANGSGGLFSKDWISLSKIATVLETQPLPASHPEYSGRYSKGQVPTMQVFWLLFYAPRIYVCWRHIQRSYLRMYYTRTGGSG
jgi:hypothetical protein